MYYSKIEAMAPVAVAQAATQPRAGWAAVLLGMAVVLIGLPLLAARVLIWAIARDVVRVVKFAGICGTAVIDAARDR